jgi:dolichol-phosphate mannosyltransferase
MAPLKISLAAPAYNEADGLADVIQSWVAYLSRSPLVSDYEIVVCNDGSRDATGEILARAAAENRRIRPVQFDANQGAAAALTAAIAHTALDWVLLIDSDGQFPVEYLESMAAKLSPGVDCVIGVRLKKEDSVFARFGTASSAALCNAFFGARCRDFNSAFKLVSGPLIRSLTLEAKGLNYSTEVTAKLLERKARIEEVEVEHRPRASGKSSVRALRDASHRLLFVLYIGFRQFLFKANVLQRPQVLLWRQENDLTLRCSVAGEAAKP